MALVVSGGDCLSHFPLSLLGSPGHSTERKDGKMSVQQRPFGGHQNPHTEAGLIAARIAGRKGGWVASSGAALHHPPVSRDLRRPWAAGTSLGLLCCAHILMGPEAFDLNSLAQLGHVTKMLQICVTVTWSSGESDVTPKSIKLVSANSTPVMDLQGSGTCHAHPSVALAFLGRREQFSQ